MGTRLWNTFKTMNETNNYINSIITGDMRFEYSYDSIINFTIKGSIISNILELDDDNLGFVFSTDIPDSDEEENIEKSSSSEDESGDEKIDVNDI